MVAFISAGPEPVVFTYPDVMFKRALDVSVGWDTGNPGVKGRVFRSLDGGNEVPLLGPDLASGTHIEKILLSQTLTFVLRKAIDRQELARSTVTTKKNALAEYMTDPNLGFIFHLKVVPTVDTVGISFETTQPALPHIEIRRHDNGELADSWMGGDYRQQHQREMSRFDASGYPQDTTFDFRIVAMKYPWVAGAHNPEIRGTFTTGSRTTTFFFDTIHVRNDGDPGGAGEFTFGFGVGDVLTQKRLGPAQRWGEGDIPAGYDRDVNKVFTINHAPRRMWAEVIAWESDTSLGDLLGHPGGLGIGQPGMQPNFDLPGSDGYEVDEGSAAWVTVHIDTAETASGRFRPFEMSTGDFSIAYDVLCRYRVLRRDGSANFPGVSSIGKVKVPKVAKLAHGRTEVIAHPAGSMSVSLSPDGGVFVRTYEPRTRQGYLAGLGGEFRAPVLLVAAPHDTLYVVGLNPRGEVVVRTVTGDCPPTGEWANLGGTFTGTVTGVTREDLIDLLASDAKGQIFHGMLRTDGSKDGAGWRRIGRGVHDAVAAVTTSGSELAVFGLAPDGRILHRRRRFAGEWLPTEGDEWQVLSTTNGAAAAGGIIRVHWANETDLIVSVFVEGELAGALLWAGYPDPDGTTDWLPVKAAVTLRTTEKGATFQS